mmetsp:Transcript_18451/g.51768  ORF Transcript_18451/g.51768 Transcript_18451/m.51768 type:complete len:296 (+) Transcript_18451:2603-3490(+)
MMVFHGRPIVVSDSQNVTALHQEVVVHTFVLKVVDDGCQVSANYSNILGFVQCLSHPSTRVNHMECAQHVRSMDAVVVGILAVIVFQTAQEPCKLDLVDLVLGDELIAGEQCEGQGGQRPATSDFIQLECIEMPVINLFQHCHHGLRGRFEHPHSSAHAALQRMHRLGRGGRESALFVIRNASPQGSGGFQLSGAHHVVLAHALLQGLAFRRGEDVGPVTAAKSGGGALAVLPIQVLAAALLQCFVVLADQPLSIRLARQWGSVRRGSLVEHRHEVRLGLVVQQLHQSSPDLLIS